MKQLGLDFAVVEFRNAPSSEAPKVNTPTPEDDDFELVVAPECPEAWRVREVVEILGPWHNPTPCETCSEVHS